MNITLKEYTEKVNILLKEECDRVNSDPNELFHAEHFDLPEYMLEIFLGWGYTPEQAIKHMEDEAEQEARWGLAYHKENQITTNKQQAK